jgi:tetratricopeptide (TPR) repeat protein
MDASALDGGIYASLGALYSKVPSGLIGFGDDEAADRYFAKALEIDGANIDNNYFYGEFLLDQGRYAQAVEVLRRALAAPVVEARPIFDAARRTAIRSLLETAERKAS